MLKILSIFCFLMTANFAIAQIISVEKLLALQKLPRIDIQDYLESNSWLLEKVVTLREADSSVFHFSGSKELKASGNSKAINFSDVAWLEFRSKNAIILDEKNFIASITINTLSYRKLWAIAIFGSGAAKGNFHMSIDYTYFGEKIHEKIISELNDLKSKIVDRNITTQDGTEKRVYKFSDNVIELVTYKINETVSKTRMHTVTVHSAQDYRYFSE